MAQVPKALTRPPGALLELLNPPEEPMEELLAKDEKELPMPRFPSAAARLEEARLDAAGRRQVAEAPGADGEGQGAGVLGGG